MTANKPKPITCYIAVPNGADEARLKAIFANMEKHHSTPVQGRSWLLRAKTGDLNSAIIGKGYALFIEPSKWQKTEIRRTGAMVLNTEPTGATVLSVQPVNGSATEFARAAAGTVSATEAQPVASGTAQPHPAPAV